MSDQHLPDDVPESFENLLRDVMRSHDHEAPTADGFDPLLMPPGSGRGRAVWTLAAAACVLALAGVVVAVRPAGSGNHAAAPGSTGTPSAAPTVVIPDFSSLPGTGITTPRPTTDPPCKLTDPDLPPFPADWTIWQTDCQLDAARTKAATYLQKHTDPEQFVGVALTPNGVELIIAGAPSAITQQAIAGSAKAGRKYLARARARGVTDATRVPVTVHQVQHTRLQLLQLMHRIARDQKALKVHGSIELAGLAMDVEAGKVDIGVVDLTAKKAAFLRSRYGTGWVTVHKEELSTFGSDEYPRTVTATAHMSIGP